MSLCSGLSREGTSSSRLSPATPGSGDKVGTLAEQLLLNVKNPQVARSLQRALLPLLQDPIRRRTLQSVLRHTRRLF